MGSSISNVLYSISMNGALQYGHCTIENGCVLVKQRVQVSKSWCERGHQFVLALVYLKFHLIKTEKVPGG